MHGLFYLKLILLCKIGPAIEEWVTGRNVFKARYCGMSVLGRALN